MGKRIKPGSPEWRDRVAAHLVELRRMIAVSGWAVQGVFATEPHGLNFAYTVGLTQRGQPELVATGALRIEFLATLLNAAAPLTLTDDQTDLTVRGSTDGDYPDIVLRLRPVTVSAPDFGLGMALQLYGPGVTAVQLLWPSDDGIYPDDPRWPAAQHGPQPLLPARTP